MTENAQNTKRICIGKIADAHGVKGLVKVKILADNMDLFGETLFISETGDETLGLSLQNSTNKFWIAHIDGIADRDAALALKGTQLFIDRETLPEAQDGEFYHTDLIGLSVEDDQGTVLGSVAAVQNYGAGDLLEIKPANGPAFLIPFADDYVPHITKEKVVIHIPEGLLPS